MTGVNRLSISQAWYTHYDIHELYPNEIIPMDDRSSLPPILRPFGPYMRVRDVARILNCHESTEALREFERFDELRCRFRNRDRVYGRFRSTAEDRAAGFDRAEREEKQASDKRHGAASA